MTFDEEDKPLEEKERSEIVMKVSLLGTLILYLVTALLSLWSLPIKRKKTRIQSSEGKLIHLK